jgi:hypothetical protein
MLKKIAKLTEYLVLGSIALIFLGCIALFFAIVYVKAGLIVTIVTVIAMLLLFNMFLYMDTHHDD